MISFSVKRILTDGNLMTDILMMLHPNAQITFLTILPIYNIIYGVPKKDIRRYECSFLVLLFLTWYGNFSKISF